ncbi:MAG TPA: sialate O-acetylesterase [Chitinophagaceae bacterium]|nr:sialate O-acetylesterase [Chitinophagaceae bacterium]
MKRNFILGTIVLTVLFAPKATANIRLPAIIGDHMVLQQNAGVKLWGWCEPLEKIKINTSWDTATYSGTGTSEAKWEIKIKTPPAGGPYTITIAGYNKIVIEDVLIGEVWDCSGQSNMEMSFSWGATPEYTADADSANNKNIRLFHIPKLTAPAPQDDTKGSWVVCNPGDMKQFSMAGYFFGKKLNEVLSAPVGLIEANWGGTPAEVWTPKDLITNNATLQKAADSLKPSDYWPVQPAATFNAMISPITNYTIAGVIWYQGESNTGSPQTYYQLFATMIRSWREAWHIDLPFYFVQIAPFSGYDGISGALLKEAQTQTLSLPRTGMVIIDDKVTDLSNIHPHDKKDVGDRLANMALSEVYNKIGFPYKYPMYQSMQVIKNKVRITFSNADDGLVNKGDTIKGFYISGADKKFYPAVAKIKGNTVIVYNKNVKEPVAVRYDFTNSSIPTLFNKDGLPANLFRTDDWDDVKTE